MFICSLWLFFVLDVFFVLLALCVFVCVWILLMIYFSFFFILYLDLRVVFWNFISSKSFDAYFFLLGSFFMVSLVFKLFLLLYFFSMVFSSFDLCKVVGMQWLWCFVCNGDSVFSNMILESDYLVGDLRLLQCNNLMIFLSLVFYKLWITSVDVIHSFTVPALGIKVDAIPGRCNELQLFSLISGSLYGQCSELCGVLHGFMPINIFFI